MGLALAGIGLVGAGISAYGAYASGQATSQMAAYQAQVARNNANVARENASMESAAGEIATTTAGLQTRARIGAYKAGLGAGGVDVNTGSAAATVAGLRQVGMQDAMTIRSNAAKRAWAQQVQATEFGAQAGLYGYESQVASSLAPVTAAGTFLSGAAGVGANYLKLQQV
jgi:hypothetical protein